MSANPVSERCLAIDCQGESLIGILARPEAPHAVGVVIVVGGPQYRVGSHRQFTLLSRHLAAAGHAVLRFDYRGMGDSGGEARDFENASDDIRAAIAALRREVPEVEHVVLWGLCDGASAALLFCLAYPEVPVAGLCLLNPWVRSPATQAATQIKHYYRKRLTDRDFWLKLLRGQVGLGRLQELLRSLSTYFAGRAKGGQGRAPAPRPSFQARMAAAWDAHLGSILLVLSGEDLTAKEFIEALAGDPAWRGASAHPRLSRVDIQGADHTFSNAATQSEVERITAQWLAQLDQSQPPRLAR